jgi:NMD protein affecting ribosome stability and mRNA decay
MKMLKKYKECGCGCDDFILTDITDNYGDSIKIKICERCGAMHKRD